MAPAHKKVFVGVFFQIWSSVEHCFDLMYYVCASASLSLLCAHTFSLSIFVFSQYEMSLLGLSFVL